MTDAQRGRLHAMLAAMARIGATPEGGVHRPAASAEDGAARDLLRGWMEDAGMRVAVDAVGNMAGLLELAGPGAPVVMAGSHLDSQPRGGRFDGALGVVAACAAALVLKEGASREGGLREQAGGGALRFRHNLAVVNWTNEEGARFQPSLLGSGVFVGEIAREHALARTDGDGIPLGAALRDIGYAGSNALPRPAAYVELHVECGGALDGSGGGLGIFTRWWGAVKQRIVFLGEQAHTGPTPMGQRRDALLGASRLVCALREMADAAPGLLHSSVGRIEVRPNSPNVVPAEAVVFAELRSPEPAVLAWAEAELARRLDAAADSAGVAYEVRAVDRRPAGAFDPGLAALAAAEAVRLGRPARTLDTVAGHDAVSLAALCPSVMLVVPSVGGVCHDASEYTRAEDVELGAELLACTLARLCAEGVGP